MELFDFFSYMRKLFFRLLFCSVFFQHMQSKKEKKSHHTKLYIFIILYFPYIEQSTYIKKSRPIST